MKHLIGRYIFGLPHNQDGRLNRQFSVVRQYEENFDFYAKVALFGWIVGSLVALAIHPRVASENIFTQPETPTPTHLIEPTPTPTGWNDAIRSIFPKDEAGRMIRICLRESGNKYAINHNTNGTFDYGWCQINSVHKPEGMSDLDWKLYLEDPQNHAKEVRRIFLSQGWSAWVVASRVH